MPNAFQVDPTFVAKVDEELSKWSQGDVAGPGVVTWITDAQPITPEGAELDPSGPTIVDARSDYVVVVTQTCDIRRSCWRPDGLGRPFVQVSPLVHLDGKDLNIAAGGFNPRFAAVPGYGDDAFADLERCTTIEKGVLVKSPKHHVGCRDDVERQAFSRSVARQRGRHAFPDGVDRTVDKLRWYLRDKRDKTSPSGQAVRALNSIRASASPSFDEEQPFDLKLIFIVEPFYLTSALAEENDEITEAYREWLEYNPKPTIDELTHQLLDLAELADRFDMWQRIAHAWAAKCEPVDPIQTVSGEAESLASYSLGRAVREPTLDLDHLTSEASRIAAGDLYDPP
jgi:hypothetical protein